MHGARRLLLVAATVAGVVAAPPADAVDGGDVAHEAGLQWGLTRVHAEEAWATSTGAGITIAIIDSGVALGHEDLADNLIEGIACRNTDGDPDRCSGSPMDHDGHGTHVAGIAAAVTGNGIGVAGTAPDASIMPVKVLFAPCDGCPSAGNASDVTAAVRWAASHGADVINLSLGSSTSSVFGPGFVDALRDAWDAGAIPVVAAGNDLVATSDLGTAPAVVVSATDHEDEAPDYSNGVGDAQWAIAAPGGDGDDTEDSCAQEGDPRGILSTYWAPDDDVGAYACLSGTSMAAPFVSGALAILLGAGLDQRAAVDALLAGAVDIGEDGPDTVFGAGLLDIEAALSHAELPAAGVGVGNGPEPMSDGDAAGLMPGSTDGRSSSTGGGRPVVPIALATALILATGGATGLLAGRDVRLSRR